jgi:hypothetical protein
MNHNSNLPEFSSHLFVYWNNSSRIIFQTKNSDKNINTNLNPKPYNPLLLGGLWVLFPTGVCGAAK